MYKVYAVICGSPWSRGGVKRQWGNLKHGLSYGFRRCVFSGLANEANIII